LEGFFDPRGEVCELHRSKGRGQAYFVIARSSFPSPFSSSGSVLRTAMSGSFVD